MPSLPTQISNAEKVEPLIRTTLERIRDSIRNNMTIKNRHASRRSSQSLRIDTTGVSGTLFGSSSFLAMEHGRKGGKVPYRFHEIIAQWIVDKGITVNNKGGINSAAYLIAKSIKEKGTTLYRRGVPDNIFSEEINRETRLLSDKIGYLLSSDITYLSQQFANPTNK